jgi:hypothetical protein
LDTKASLNDLGAVLYNQDDPLKPYNVTLTRSNSFNGNDDEGLSIFSYGAILVNNLTANDNGFVNTNGNGAFLDNCDWNGSACDTNLLTPKPVTINGTVNVSGNYLSGLYIDGPGAVTLSNIFADSNGDFGVAIYNGYNNAKPNNVTLKGTNTFTTNGADGLKIDSYGTIALSNVTANWNDGYGAYLDNFLSGGALVPKSITLTGVNSFIGNYMDGLYFDSLGSVALSRVTASENDFYANAYAGSRIKGFADGGITLTCANTFSNEGSGYELDGFGSPIIINGIYSAYNGVADSAPSATIKYPCLLP